MRLPTAATSGENPGITRRTFEAASTTKATASQPKARYTLRREQPQVGELAHEQRRGRRVIATGTFQAYEDSGRAQESTGQ